MKFKVIIYDLDDVVEVTVKEIGGQENTIQYEKGTYKKGLKETAGDVLRRNGWQEFVDMANIEFTPESAL